MDPTPTDRALGLPATSDHTSSEEVGRPPPSGGQVASLSDRVDDAFRRLDDLRSHPATVGAAAVAVLLLVFAAWWFGRSPEPRPVEDLIPQIALETTTPPTTEASIVFVHVSGAVFAPGVYELSSTARVLDAIAAAGGPQPGADLHQLNLAAPVADGIQVRVPMPGEIVAVEPQPNGESGTPIDVNRATASELETLSGVGPATAAAIVQWRGDNGPFLTVDDLLDVPGIGPAKLAGLEDQVVVR